MRTVSRMEFAAGGAWDARPAEYTPYALRDCQGFPKRHDPLGPVPNRFASDPKASSLAVRSRSGPCERVGDAACSHRVMGHRGPTGWLARFAGLAGDRADGRPFPTGGNRPCACSSSVCRAMANGSVDGGRHGRACRRRCDRAWMPGCPGWTAGWRGSVVGRGPGAFA